MLTIIRPIRPSERNGPGSNSALSSARTNSSRVSSRRLTLAGCSRTLPPSTRHRRIAPVLEVAMLGVFGSHHQDVRPLFWVERGSFTFQNGYVFSRSSEVPTLPRLGSRVRIPSPAPVFINYIKGVARHGQIGSAAAGGPVTTRSPPRNEFARFPMLRLSDRDLNVKGLTRATNRSRLVGRALLGN